MGKGTEDKKNHNEIGAAANAAKTEQTTTVVNEEAGTSAVGLLWSGFVTLGSLLEGAASTLVEGTLSIPSTIADGALTLMGLNIGQDLKGISFDLGDKSLLESQVHTVAGALQSIQQNTSIQISPSIPENPAVLAIGWETKQGPQNIFFDLALQANIEARQSSLDELFSDMRVDRGLTFRLLKREVIPDFSDENQSNALVDASGEGVAPSQLLRTLSEVLPAVAIAVEKKHLLKDKAATSDEGMFTRRFSEDEESLSPTPPNTRSNSSTELGTSERVVELEDSQESTPEEYVEPNETVKEQLSYLLSAYMRVLKSMNRGLPSDQVQGQIKKLLNDLPKYLTSPDDLKNIERYPLVQVLRHAVQEARPSDVLSSAQTARVDSWLKTPEGQSIETMRHVFVKDVEKKEVAQKKQRAMENATRRETIARVRAEEFILAKVNELLTGVASEKRVSMSNNELRLYKDFVLTLVKVIDQSNNKPNIQRYNEYFLQQLLDMELPKSMEGKLDLEISKIIGMLVSEFRSRSDHDIDSVSSENMKATMGKFGGTQDVDNESPDVNSVHEHRDDVSLQLRSLVEQFEANVQDVKAAAQAKQAAEAAEQQQRRELENQKRMQVDKDHKGVENYLKKLELYQNEFRELLTPSTALDEQRLGAAKEKKEWIQSSVTKFKAWMSSSPIEGDDKNRFFARVNEVLENMDQDFAVSEEKVKAAVEAKLAAPPPSPNNGVPTQGQGTKPTTGATYCSVPPSLDTKRTIDLSQDPRNFRGSAQPQGQAIIQQNVPHSTGDNPGHQNNHDELGAGGNQARVAASNSEILAAMDAAITAAKKSWGISWRRGANKEEVLQALRDEYANDTATENLSFEEVNRTQDDFLRRFIFLVAEARTPLSIFGKANEGHTASAKAFYQALDNNDARGKVAEVLRVDSLDAPEPDGSNQDAFANAVRVAKNRPELEVRVEGEPGDGPSV